MKRRYILTLLLACICSFAHAYDFVVDGIAYTITSMSNFECEVAANDTPYEGKVVIPADVQFRNKKLAVTSVGASSFKNAESLSEVILPATTTTLGDSCFYGCTQLERVEFGAESISIGSLAFCNCSSLESIQLPLSVDLGNSVFAGCKSLKAIDLSMLTVIPWGTCEGCESLINITFSNSLTGIGGSAFKGCTNLADVRISNLPLKIIGVSAFSGCKKISSIEFGDSLETIYNYAFENTSIKNFVVPNNVTSIGKCIVSGENLNSFTLGNGVTELKYNPLAENAQLNSLTFVDGDKNLYFGTTNNSSNDYVNYSHYHGCRLTYGIFSSLKGDSIYTIKIDSLYIGRPLRQRYDTLKTNGEKIIYGARPPFWHNKSLKNVVFSSYGDIKIGVSSKDEFYITNNYFLIPFYKCTALEKIAFLGNSIDIPKYQMNDTKPDPFKTCTSLKTVIINGTFTYIPDRLFKGCASLKDIHIGSNIKTIYTDAFSDCDSLSNIYCMAITPPKYDTGFTKDLYLNCNLYVPQASMEIYQQTSPWNNFWNICSGVSKVVNDAHNNIKFDIVDGNIIVTGKQSNDYVQVYTIQGQLVAQTNSDIVPIRRHGAYIVRIGNFSQKIVL